MNILGIVIPVFILFGDIANVDKYMHQYNEDQSSFKKQIIEREMINEVKVGSNGSETTQEQRVREILNRFIIITESNGSETTRIEKLLLDLDIQRELYIIAENNSNETIQIRKVGILRNKLGIIAACNTAEIIQIKELLLDLQQKLRIMIESNGSETTQIKEK